jgi:HSP20 family molecular chaperone IbpA
MYYSMLKTLFDYPESMFNLSTWTLDKGDDSVNLQVNVVGLSKEDLRLSSEPYNDHYDKLLIRKVEGDEEKSLYAFKVPNTSLNISELDASCENGLLKINIPKKKKEEKKQKHFKIN